MASTPTKRDVTKEYKHQRHKIEKDQFPVLRAAGYVGAGALGSQAFNALRRRIPGLSTPLFYGGMAAGAGGFGIGSDYVDRWRARENTQKILPDLNPQHLTDASKPEYGGVAALAAAVPITAAVLGAHKIERSLGHRSTSLLPSWLGGGGGGGGGGGRATNWATDPAAGALRAEGRALQNQVSELRVIRPTRGEDARTLNEIRTQATARINELRRRLRRTTYAAREHTTSSGLVIPAGYQGPSISTMEFGMRGGLGRAPTVAELQAQITQSHSVLGPHPLYTAAQQQQPTVAREAGRRAAMEQHGVTPPPAPAPPHADDVRMLDLD